jgi:putative transposase
MKALYQMVGVSKQAVHKFTTAQHQLLSKQENLIELATDIRKRHPHMGSRTMHGLMCDPGFGRDECERILLANGFRIKRKPNYLKTTVSQSIFKFPNLIKGLQLQGINQVWQTDITFFFKPGLGVFYLIFIIDVYSRRIIGHTAHEHMRAEANVLCLEMAIKTRVGYDLSSLIHHSDRGGQFIFKSYLDLLHSLGIRVSMSKEAWQNAYTERINGTIKNDYLRHRNIKSLNDLRRILNQDIALYNNERPHKNLPFKMSPIQFESYLKQAPKTQHPIIKIYDHDKDKKRSELPLTQTLMETLFRFP